MSTETKHITDRITVWVGTNASLILHTAVFSFAFLAHWLFGLSIDFILLVLTTAVSLEAIYLAIFIQRAVNQQAARLDDVEESIDDVEEALDDVEEDIEGHSAKQHRSDAHSTQLLKELHQAVHELQELVKTNKK